MKVGILDPVKYNLGPEDVAMIQARLSRSDKGLEHHLEHVLRVGPGKFMNKFVVNYGHDSIADCGTVNVVIEDVSLLAAKALQQHPLYNGQESSTRYQNFVEKQLVDPLGGKFGELQKTAIPLYRDIFNYMKTKLSEESDYRFGGTDPVLEKAIKARAFDVARGFLPCGVVTNVSITMNIRNIRDHLRVLYQLRQREVRDIASCLWNALAKDVAPNTITNLTENKDWNRVLADDFHCRIRGDVMNAQSSIMKLLYKDDIWTSDHGRARIQLLTRMKRQRCKAIPKSIQDSARIRMRYALDYGSYRDLQRHRNGHHQLCIVRPHADFDSWYVNKIDAPDLLERLWQYLYKLRALAAQYSSYLLEMNTELEFQNYCLLGQRVQGEMTMNLGQAIYLAELRCGKTVHPTLLRLASSLADFLEDNFPQISLYIDRDDDPGVVWQRGEQDQVEKNA